MLKVDFHSHSLFSGCGMHTVVEMLTSAKNAGLNALAITDHGTAIDSKISSPFFDRLRSDVVKGIRLLKGMESNVINDEGDIDFPIKFLRFTDIVLIGLHNNLDAQPKKDDYTDMLLSALRKNPYIDVITHANDDNYPVDFDRVAAAAKGYGMAIEFNNAKVLYKRVSGDSTERLIESCRRVGCRAVISGDAHALHEIGLDDTIRPLLKKASFPKKLIVNETVEGAFAFIEERRKVKQAFVDQGSRD